MSSEPKRKPEVLELVHSDVCGPVKTRSLGSAYYFVTFIDDHSRKIWAYTLKTKDQVLDTFKLFQASVERETGKKLKCIRRITGKSIYMSPKVSSKDSTIEWFDVPNHVWSGKDVSYAHLRVFGCMAYVHISKDERSKLDEKSKKCVFVGYELDEFGYRFFDLVQRKLICSRDVVFMEDYTIEDIDKVEKEDPTLKTKRWEINVENEVDHEVESVEQPIVSNELRRSTRDRRPSVRYSSNEYIFLTDGGEPESFEEVLEDENKKEWMDAMEDEMQSLRENNTFELVKLPNAKKVLKNRWVYRIKQDESTSQK
ncbi:hypothetical protein LIER_36475 [Lithospermum erythrorhizon]|uniref:Retroviral polymerase SH3-like domain-containing protein n=1 Tax=Lithospermum erythrorhizon TaxID=34254 RepID=A0AAV3P6G6_LITER